MAIKEQYFYESVEDATVLHQVIVLRLEGLSLA
jgi:hypothetical protein